MPPRTALAALAFAVSSPASAETLKEALTAAYLYNPTLKSARAQLRATDNGVAQAKSGYRPTITASFLDGYDNVRTKVAASAAAQQSLAICGSVTPPSTCNPPFTALPLSSFSSASVGNGPSNPR
jgi:outer membrane protein